jgi:Tfp pilus assembly protein PilP
MRPLVCLALLLAGTAHAGPEAKRDPFRSPLKGDAPSVQPVIGRAALFGDVAVEDLTLKGVVQTPHGPSALLLAPSGVSRVVRQGDILGQHWARLHHIGERSVSFVIELRDVEGVLVERRPVLRMKGGEALE